MIKLLLSASNIQLHIELKGPAIADEAIARYDYYKACQLACDLIDKYNIGERSIVTSFDPQIVNNMVKVREKRQVDIKRDFKICHLVNRKYQHSVIGY